ncbi:sensor histidine kinase [Promicromonospora thailandica]|uniref:histidine kinase n=1 Tax=Promicromonospora thailandica TaxID=765201 RepID=A0A9X2G858_9MICO|nr:HAMP domain-containing sensor histidine kinase [Promicromonospora thailandica]MCP2264371.1 two-component system, OmpR family, sensor histidine kinase BaeS [Promicromonospora thailandica]BFF20936.1 hypothetical protein GCM10025730_44570 [Promicromonospora thailandica]
MARGGVPLHRSLVTRLIAMSLAVCAVSVAATAWLVVRSTDAAIEEVNGQTLRDDAVVYGVLLDWARDHRDWSGVQPLLVRLANRTGYHILLTDTEGVLLADSAAAPGTPPAAGTAVDLADTRAIVDPAQVDWSLLQHAPGAQEAEPTPSAVPSVVPSTEPSVEPSSGPVPDARRSRAAAAAPGTDQVAVPPSAPSARLFITGREPVASTFVDLSAPSRARIAGLAALVLALAAGVSVAVGLRITRPLRELASAARRMTDGDDDARALVRTRDEIGEVATAFNSLAERRGEQERLRRAMVGDVAHELRTPLSSVRGWLEAAQDGLTPTDRGLVDSLHEEALHLQHLVADLQDLALADAGELRLHPEPVDLAAVLEQVVRGQGAAASAKGVRLAARAPGVSVHADPVRLRQAVTNLVANAVRHTPSGGSVEVTGAPDGGVVVVRVRDTGEGIAAADLPHVFERFWRADASRTRGTGGSGLGLAIVRQVAELHGGSVGVESVVGRGTTFMLRLPADAGRAGGADLQPAGRGADDR